MVKKCFIFLIPVLVLCGIGFVVISFIASETRAEDGAIFGTRTVVIPDFPDIEICIGTPRDCVIVYPQE